MINIWISQLILSLAVANDGMRPLTEAHSEGACPFRTGALVPLNPYKYVITVHHD
jgi:hypothetical protein